MTNTNRCETPFADAYSFSYYGAKNWQACIDMLIARGYNTIEVECIMRSVFTRYATDNVTGRRKANAADLADLMDHRSGGVQQLREYIDETVLETMMPTPDVLPSRVACRLVWSR